MTRSEWGNGKHFSRAPPHHALPALQFEPNDDDNGDDDDDDDDDNGDNPAAANCKELVFDCLLFFTIFARGTKKIFAMTASILSLLFIKASKFQEDSSLTNFLHLWQLASHPTNWNLLKNIPNLGFCRIFLAGVELSFQARSVIIRGCKGGEANRDSVGRQDT